VDDVEQPGGADRSRVAPVVDRELDGVGADAARLTTGQLIAVEAADGGGEFGFPLAR
jgi:hypothetical protein